MYCDWPRILYITCTTNIQFWHACRVSRVVYENCIMLWCYYVNKLDREKYNQKKYFELRVFIDVEKSRIKLDLTVFF